MRRALKVDKDGRLAVSEAHVQRTCIEWMEKAMGFTYISTNASDRKRNGRPAFKVYTLDGLFVSPRRGDPVIFAEWKRRNACTSKARREGQANTERRLMLASFCVIRMPDQLREDPVAWFKAEVMRLL